MNGGEGVISPNVRTNEWNKQTESPVAINECKSPSRRFPWIVEDFVVFYFEVFCIFVCAPKFEGSAEMTINLFCIIRDVQTVPLPKWVPCPLWRPVSALLSLNILTPFGYRHYLLCRCVPSLFLRHSMAPRHCFCVSRAFSKVQAAPQKNIGPHVAHGTWGPRRFSIYILTICSRYGMYFFLP